MNSEMVNIEPCGQPLRIRNHLERLPLISRKAFPFSSQFSIQIRYFFGIPIFFDFPMYPRVHNWSNALRRERVSQAAHRYRDFDLAKGSNQTVLVVEIESFRMIGRSQIRLLRAIAREG